VDVGPQASIGLRTALNASKPSSGRALVDLSATTFIDAYGIVVAACGFLDGLESDGSHITLPKDRDAGVYLARMHLGKVLGGRGGTASGSLPDISEHDQHGNLLELRPFDGMHGAEEVAGIAFHRLEGHADAQIVAALYDAVVELGANAAEHSGSSTGALACAQTYKRGQPDEYLTIAIGDVGIGVPTALRRTHEVSDDGEALRLALERDVSGTGDVGRGQGLADLVEFTRDLGALLVLQSGAGLAYVEDGQVRVRSAPRVPGTLVGMELPCRPDGSKRRWIR
jgi:hypothetical protein